QRFEEIHHVSGRIPGRGEDLRAAHVRLRLDVAAVLQEECVEADSADRVDDLRGSLPDFAAEDSAENADARLREIRLRGLMRPMPQRDVRDLVSEHTRHFALVARVVEYAAIHEDITAGQRERVDVRLI